MIQTGFLWIQRPVSSLKEFGQMTPKDSNDISSEKRLKGRLILALGFKLGPSRNARITGIRIALKGKFTSPSRNNQSCFMDSMGCRLSKFALY